jgi:hypothetical protein
MVCLNILVRVQKLLHIMGKMSENSSMHEPCTDYTADFTSCIQVILLLLYEQSLVTVHKNFLILGVEHVIVSS